MIRTDGVLTNKRLYFLFFSLPFWLEKKQKRDTSSHGGLIRNQPGSPLPASWKQLAFGWLKKTYLASLMLPSVFVEIFYVTENTSLDTVSSSHHCATSKTLLGFGVLGSLSEWRLTTSLVRVVSAVYDCAPSLSPALRSLHGRPGCSGSNRSTDLFPLPRRGPLSLYPRRWWGVRTHSWRC